MMKTEKSSQPEAVLKKSSMVTKAASKEKAATLAEKEGSKKKLMGAEKEGSKKKLIKSKENEEMTAGKGANKEKSPSLKSDDKKSVNTSMDSKKSCADAAKKKTRRRMIFGFDELKRRVLMSKEVIGDDVDQDGEVPPEYEEALAAIEVEKIEPMDLNKKTIVGDDYHVKSDPWKWKNWKDFACLGAMLALLLDPTQTAAFISMAFKNGGLYFVGSYLILTFLVQLPVLQLYVHIGQFHQKGVMRVFSVYGPIYRAIGICALVIYPISQIAKLESSVYNIVTAYSQGPNLTSIVSCVGNPYSYYGEYKYRDFCCHSLYDRMTCHDMKPKPEWCQNKRKISHQKETAPGFHVKRLYGEQGTSEIIPSVTVGLVLVLAALGTFVPRPIFAVGVAVCGLIGLVLLVVLVIMQLSVGNFGIGFRRLIRITYIYSFLNYEAPFMVLQFIVWTSLSKFPLISIASMVSPGKKMYWPVIGIHVTHVLMTLIIFAGDLSMYGFFEQASLKFMEIPYWPSSMGALGYFHGILPEFFAITGTSGWYLFALSILLFVAVGPFCGSLFDSAANSFKRKKRRPYRHISGTCIVAGMWFSAATLGQFYPPAVFAMHLITTIMYGALVFVIVECTVRLYGENHHEIDLAAMYPPKNNWKDFFGPQSPFYVYTLRYIVPLSMLAFVSLGLHFFSIKVAPTLDDVSSTICYGCGVFVLGSFIGGLIYDLIMIRRKELPLWRTFLPTKGHRAYYRFFPSSDILDEMVKTQESLETLSEGSDEEVNVWDVFNSDNTQSDHELDVTQRDSNPDVKKRGAGGSSRRLSGKNLKKRLNKKSPGQS